MAQEAAHEMTMRNRFLTAATVSGTIAIVSLMPATLAGQAKIPRTADGKPDLTGMYDVATMTPVERASRPPVAPASPPARR